MSKIMCPNRKHPDWIRLENAVGEFEAFRDYMQYGETRDPFVVFEKLQARAKRSITQRQMHSSDVRVRKLMKATDKYEVGVMATVLQRIRNTPFNNPKPGEASDFVISQRAWKKDDQNANITLITVPKIYTELDAARGARQGENAIPGTKDSAKWDALKMMLYYEDQHGHDVSFIDLVETENAYIIKVPTNVYEAAKTQKATPENFVTYYRGNDNEAIEIDSDSVIGNVINTLGSPAISPQDKSNAQALTQVESLAMLLSENLKSNGENMAYEFIDEVAAKALHEKINKQWNGEKAFFVGDTVYFVGKNLSLDTVFHEFSHPIVRSLAKSNPALFNKYFADLGQTAEGRLVLDEVRNLYPEYQETDMLFKEEAVVRALTAAAAMKKQDQPKSKDFAGLLKNIFSAIRQALRKLFNKKPARDVSTLSENTTLQELAEMILSKEESLDLGKDTVSDSDSIAYIRDMEQYIKDVLNINDKDLVSLNIHAHDIALKHVENLRKNKNYKEAAKLLIDEYGRGDLQEIEKSLSQYAKSVDDKLLEIKNKIQYDKDRATAMINSLFRLQTVMTKIKKHIDVLKENPDDIDNMNKAWYYEHLVNYWKTFADEFTQALDAAEISTSSPLSNLVNSVQRQMQQIQKETKQFYKKGSKEILAQTLYPAMERMQEKHDNVIEHLKRKGASKELIDREIEEFYGLNAQEQERKETLEKKKSTQGIGGSEIKELDALNRKSFAGARLTPEKIEMALEGKIEDANIFNSFFEGYMYNTDPVVGGFALFVKNHMSDVMSITQNKFNDYAKDIAPLLEKAGYTPADTDKLIQRIGRIELIGRFNSEGKWEEKPVWVFKSAHKDWRIEIDRLTKATNEAETEWRTTNTDEAKAKFIEARTAKSKFLRLYFHQRYKPEVYAAEELLEKDVIGQKAKFLMSEIFQELERVTAPLTNQIEELSQADQVDKLWQRYNQLFSLTDVFGQSKPVDSEEYKIAVRLNEYKAAGIDPKTGKSYREWVLREGVFQTSLDEFRQELANSGRSPEEQQELLDKWFKKNLRTAIKPEFYNERTRILNEIKELLSTLPDEEAKELKGAETYEKIFSIMRGYRDDDNQPNGLELTPEALKEIHRLEKELKAFNDSLVKMSGLTQSG